MFGDRSPLMQEEDGTSGGGGTSFTDFVTENGQNLLMGPFAGTKKLYDLGKSAIDKKKAISEAEAKTPDTVDTVGGAGEPAPSRSGEGNGEVPDELAVPKAQTNYYQETRITPGGTPTEVERYNEAKAAIEMSDRRTRLAEMKAMGYAEAEMIDYANIHSMDAEEGRRLHTEHFAVAKQRSNQLYQRVQEARTMQVDPFNWHKSIGRGGRVASAFSMLTGQIAAGGGNPSSALKMMDSAIERDISAQETNIKNEYENLKLVKGLDENDRAMFLEELGSLNETRAVRYAAMLSKIEAAKQHAINESAYNSYKVMGDHYTMKLLESLWAARAEILTIHGKGPIQASKIRMINRQIAQIQKDLTDPYIQRELNAREAAGALQAGADQALPAGEQATTAGAEPSLPAAPGRAGAVGPRRGAQAQTGGTPPEQARPAEGDTAPATERDPLGPAERKEFQGEDNISRLETQEEANARSKGERTQRETEDSVLTREPKNVRQVGQRAMVRGHVDVDEMNYALKTWGGANNAVIQHNGWGRAMNAQRGVSNASTLGQTDAQNSYIRGEVFQVNDSDSAGFKNQNDAQYFADWLPAPRRSEYPDPEKYRNAVDEWNYRKNHWETFEAPGQQTSFEAGGRNYRIKGTSTARQKDSTGINEYNTIVSKVTDSWAFVQNLRDTAANIRRVGIGSGGWFNAEEGAFSIPGIFSTDPGTKELTNTTLRLAMGFIKSEDPTARLSDNDIKIGEKAMALALQGKAMTIADIIQGLGDGDWTNNTVRQAMDRYMQKLALNAQKAIIKQYSNDIVIDYNSSIAFEKENNERMRWMATTPGWAQRTVTP